MRCDLFILHFKSNFKKFWFVLFQKKKKSFLEKNPKNQKKIFFSISVDSEGFFWVGNQKSEIWVAHETKRNETETIFLFQPFFPQTPFLKVSYPNFFFLANNWWVHSTLPSLYPRKSVNLDNIEINFHFGNTRIEPGATGWGALSHAAPTLT